LIVSHDALDARTLGKRIAVLEAGRITQLGSWAELEAKPATHFVSEFVRSIDAHEGGAQ
jgi:molybdate transport system ATP-binding protein